MNMEDARRYFQDLGCFPHQVEFALKFLAPNSERKHRLTSDPGLGKGFVGGAIVGYVAKHELARRILVLAPMALTSQWVETIRRDNSYLMCDIVGQRRLRELEASDEGGNNPWEHSGIVVMSIDFAKRPETAALLMQTEWDFLVVDEAHRLSPRTLRQQVVCDLVNRNSGMRVLYLQTLSQTLVGEENDELLFRDVETTTWSRDTVRGRDGKPLLPEVKIEWISHRRRPDEVAVLNQLQESLHVITGLGEQGRFIGTRLLKAASSSLFALEQQLNRMRQRRNQTAHGQNEILHEMDDDSNLWLDNDEVGSTWDLQPQAMMKFSDRISDLLLKLEDVSSDSKFESLLSLLDALGVLSSSDRRVCIFTSYVDTASYLESALREHHSRVAAVTGSHSSEERTQAVANLADHGGILIATSVVTMPMPEVTAVIFYDLPMNPAALDAHIGQFIRVGRSNPVHVFAFMDESQSLVFEKLQRKLMEIKKTLGRDDMQTLFSNNDDE
jgi:superfamily II DNA or RNA helicase